MPEDRIASKLATGSLQKCGLQDITGQVFVLRQFAQVAVDVIGVDQDRLFVVGAGQITGAERHLFKQALEQGVQATGTDVFGFLVDLPGDLGDTLDAVRLELDAPGLRFSAGRNTAR